LVGVTEHETVTKTRLEKPRLYKVILNNDDYTPQDFVCQILTDLFNKTPAEAYDLMMQVHKQGKGIAGVYSKEIAEHKVYEVIKLAKHYKHPLLAHAEVE
jgi:ATP-dependent Clp protease adaptor protein ClpS